MVDVSSDARAFRAVSEVRLGGACGASVGSGNASDSRFSHAAWNHNMDILVTLSS